MPSPTGGIPKIGRLASGEEGRLDRLVALVSEYMRDALKRMIARAVAGTALSGQDAWNTLVLNKLGDSASHHTMPPRP